MNYPCIDIGAGSIDLSGHSLVVNATPLGMNDVDLLPMDVSRIAPETFVGEYLEFFGFPTTTPEHLRALSKQ